MLDFSKPLYALAPLAGFTDLPFRSLVKQFGVDLTVSEMISANALVHNSQKTFHMLKKSPLETPYSVQIAGSNPEVIRGAVEILNDFDYIDIIDLNCGCPAPKIVNNLSGSSLLTDLSAMGKAIETIKRYSNKPYTSVKIRLGFNEKNHIEIAKVCEQSGADFIAVHGRTRAGRYKAPVDYDAIAEVKASVSIPVIANGDIDSPEKSQWVLEYTKCDGVMIGRAAVGKPWIFSLIKGQQDINEKELIKKAVVEHFHQMIEHYGDYGAIMFRKHLHTYSKAGYAGASSFRDTVNRTDKPDEMLELIKNFF
jgi:tRNA-dihydrouridine synthase B